MFSVLNGLSSLVLRDTHGVSGPSQAAELYKTLQADQTKLDKLQARTQTKDVRQAEETVLLHDVVALERVGALPQEDKQFVDDLVGKIRSKPGFIPSAEELQKLDQIVEKAMTGLAPPESGGEHAIGESSAYDEAMAQSHAAVTDVTTAMAERPRTFPRLGGVITECNKQIDRIEGQVLPDLKRQQGDLAEGIRARTAALTAELQGKGKGEADIAAALQADPELTRLNTEKKAVDGKVDALTATVGDLRAASTQGVKNLDMIRTIVANEKARVAGIADAEAKLTMAWAELPGLELEVKAAKTPQEVEAAKGKLEKARQDMVGALTSLRELYVERDGSKGSIAMIDKQLEKLNALSGADPETTLAAIRATEADVFKTLDTEVAAGKLSRDERDKLKGLKGVVDGAADAHVSASKAATRELTWMSKEAAVGKAALLADPKTPDDIAGKMLMRDGKITPDELEALRKRFTDGKATTADMERLLKAAGMADDAATKMAGWLTAPKDEDFRRMFGLDGKFPITVDTKSDGASLQIVDKTLTDVSSKPGTVEPKVHLDPLREPYTTTGPVEAKRTFKGGGELDAQVYTVEVRGKKIEVIMPKDVSGVTGNLPTLDQVAKSLALLPQVELDAVTKVTVNPQRNPDDAYWAVKYNKPGFYSAATGGGNAIDFYPKPSAWSQDFMDSTTIHEGGHNLSRKLDKYDEKKEWKDAIAADTASASTYADSSTAEDFAETITLYCMGGKDDPEVRAKYGHRFDLLDKIFAAEKK